MLVHDFAGYKKVVNPDTPIAPPPKTRSSPPSMGCAQVVQDCVEGWARGTQALQARMSLGYSCYRPAQSLSLSPSSSGQTCRVQRRRVAQFLQADRVAAPSPSKFEKHVQGSLVTDLAKLCLEAKVKELEELQTTEASFRPRV